MTVWSDIRTANAIDVRGATEIVSERRAVSKTFDLGDGRRKLVSGLTPLHYDDNGLKEIDLTPVERRDHWLIDKAPFVLKVWKGRPGFEYRSRRGGRAKADLMAMDGQARTLASQATVHADGLQWADVAPNLDIQLRVKPHKVEFFKILKAADAYTAFDWDVEHDAGQRFRVGRTSRGYDARPTQVKDRHRHAEMRVTVSNERSVDGKTSFRYREEFRGRVSDIVDKRTRQRQWKDNLRYPITIDAPDITENLVDADDVAQLNANLYTTFTTVGAGLSSFGSYVQRGGLRYQTIAVPNGATIDLAVIKTTRSSTFGSPQIQWYGDDVDDAAAWSGSSKPSDITKTTASANANTGAGLQSQDITSIVQEIVNRGGWSSNNDMRFALDHLGGTTTGVWAFYDVAHPTGAPAVLEIDYTVGGAAGQPAVKRFGGVPYMAANRGVW